jgi:hypothetical protein
MEAHERWAYDDRAGVQALRRLIYLCNDCHLSILTDAGVTLARPEPAAARSCRSAASGWPDSVTATPAVSGRQPTSACIASAAATAVRPAGRRLWTRITGR